ncbi:MAG TPA: hypothetical protein VGU20_01705 [Stellaceae bacterium]|nr:hypothetical protein [Stellaceae bacterium]
MLWLQHGGDKLTLETALGFQPGWRALATRHRRNEILREIARIYFPELQGRKRARAIARSAGAYEGNGWLRDRRSGRRPDGLKGLFYDLLSIGEVPSEERLRQLFCDFPG